MKRYTVTIAIDAEGPGAAKNEVLDRLNSLEDINSIGVKRRLINSDGSKNVIEIDD